MTEDRFYWTLDKCGQTGGCANTDSKALIRSHFLKSCLYRYLGMVCCSPLDKVWVTNSSCKAWQDLGGEVK